MKTKKLYYSLLVAFCCFIVTGIKAQTQPLNYIPPVFAQPPNQAAFAKYGDYQVNLYSGLPDISIPLYTIEAGSLKVPVTLSYHASGIKVDQAATWVGLGWSLNAAGGITRNVYGTPDEQGYFAYQGISSLNPHNAGGLDSLYRIANLHGHDTRPDIYSYDLPGLNGKFFFNGKNGFAPTFIPFAPVSLQKVTGTPFAFNIQDEHGNIYRIGHSITEHTTTYYTNGSGPFQAVTGWMLEQMISQSRRDTINFSYLSQSIAPPDQTGQTTIVEDQEALLASASGCPVTYANTTPVTVVSDVSSDGTEQDIQQISYKNGKVVFSHGSTPRQDVTETPYGLDTIKVYSYNFGLKKYELQKSIIFYKSYFNVLTSGSQRRLRLDSIQITDKAGGIVQHYRFGYNQQTLPAYSSYSKDFWGYYNGKMDDPNITNKTLIPQTVIDDFPTSSGQQGPNITIGSSIANSRYPDSTYMQAGILDTIYYPTGGKTIFTYQTNRYFDSNNNMQLTGGLRIASITSYDGITSTPIIKTYQYNTAVPNFLTNTTGQLNYGFFSSSQTHQYWIDPSTPGHPSLDRFVCKTKRVRAYFSDPGNNLTPSSGNPVAYTNVTEYIGTPSVNIGKSVYSFSNVTDVLQTASLTRIPIIYDYGFSRGQLLDKSDYKIKSDGSYQLVKEVVNSYTAYPETRYDAVGVVVGQVKVDEGALTEVYFQNFSPDDMDTYPASNYAIVSDDNHLTSTTTYAYDMNDPSKSVSSSASFGYGNITYQQIASTTHIDSKGNTHVNRTKYAFDYIPSGGNSTGNAILDSMVKRHMYAEPVEKWDSLRDVSTSSSAITSAQFTRYKYGSIPYSIVPSNISILNIGGPVTDFVRSSVISGNLTGDSRYTQMISFDVYDTQNNIGQYTPRNSRPVSILWDYQSELPVAQIKNATYSYAGNTQVAYTSFEAPRNGGWYYTGTPVKDITAPTGSYVYPLSAGSITLSAVDNTKSYVLSYWSNTGTATVSYQGNSVAATALRTVNGWTYYEHQLPSGSLGAITISGTTSVDELRLYPAAAQMTTYAYDPSGIRSIMDTKGQVSYFEYDAFERLKNTKDWLGNITKNYGYHTYDQTIPNDAIAATTFTRDNCPSGTSPQSTTYSVPAGRYVSSTKASANAEAQYDLQTNGQARADDPAICGCPVTLINFTLTNNSTHSGYQVTFNGIAPFPFPDPGLSSTIHVPAGTYSTVNINGTVSGTFTLGGRASQTGNSVTFNSVLISSTSTDSSLTAQ